MTEARRKTSARQAGAAAVDEHADALEALAPLDVDDVVIEAKPTVASGLTGFVRVASPTLWPNGCVICKSSTGPLLDTLRELGANLGRIYVCSACLKLMALELGLIEGERMNELLDAAGLLDAASTALKDRDAQIGRMLGESAAATRKIEALEELLRQERDAQRAQRHMLEMINETSKQLLTVGNGS